MLNDLALQYAQAWLTTHWPVLVILPIALIAAYILVRSTATRRMARNSILGIAAVLVVLLGVTPFIHAYTGIQHGAYDFTSYTAGEIVEHTKRAPVDQSDQVPENPKNLLLYVYRWSCPDCEAVGDDVRQWMQQFGIKTLDVSSRSDFGVALKEQGALTEVPSVIYYDSKGNRLVRVAYTTTSVGETILDKTRLESIEKAIMNDKTTMEEVS